MLSACAYFKPVFTAARRPKSRSYPPAHSDIPLALSFPSPPSNKIQIPQLDFFPPPPPLGPAERGCFSLRIWLFVFPLSDVAYKPIFQHYLRIHHCSIIPKLVALWTADMNTGVHRGFLRKYGGFMFKQWKEKYLVLTAEGSLLVCRDLESPPDQVISLQSNCETIAEGRDILDLPKLPVGARRDCCFALLLPQNKFLLLLADNPDDCNLWLNLIRKVREGVMSPMSLQRQRSITPCISDRDSLLDSCSDKDPGSPKICDNTPPLSRMADRGGSFKEPNQVNGVRRPLRSVSVAPPHRVSDCLRHGNSSDARAVRAVCLLMGGAAASSALGYLNSCAPTSPLATSRPPEITSGSGGFSELSTGGAFHACSQDVDSPHINSFDFEGDSDFDAFDCGSFAF